MYSVNGRVMFVFAAGLVVACADSDDAARSEVAATDAVVSDDTPSTDTEATLPDAAADTEAAPPDVATDTDATPETLAPPTSDFVPPTGAGAHAGIEGPWARRILGARSVDGLAWVKTGVVISDQADVPDLVVDDRGWLYLYYYGWTVGPRQNVPAMAISADAGATWTFKFLAFDGFPGRGDVADPHVEYLDRAFRIFGSTRTDHTFLTWGESADGVTFTYGGVAFDPGENAGVAATYQVGTGATATWHLLSLASIGLGNDEEPGRLWHATSADGKAFTLVDKPRYEVDGGPLFPGNVVPCAGGFRFYLFSDMRPMRSYFSADGTTWTLEVGDRLVLDVGAGLEKGYVGDPDVVQLPDGSWFMAYATLIP